MGSTHRDCCRISNLMKLRINGNSLRFRVTPSELTRLLEDGRIQEIINFASHPQACLAYALEHTPLAETMAIRYTPGEILVLVPSTDAENWARGQDVGIYGRFRTGHGTLDVALEKDFACLDKSDADNADTFPNPKQGTAF